MTKEGRLKTHLHSLKMNIPSPYAEEFKDYKEEIKEIPEEIKHKKKKK